MIMMMRRRRRRRMMLMMMMMMLIMMMMMMMMMVVMVNDKESKFTGTSGTIAWELEEENVHLIVMWSIPYNLKIYNSYFAIGVVQLSTRFTRDMLPYWYKQMIENKQGRTFQRGKGGKNL